MVSFTFCSTLAHIVRRYELGDRRALNILNWPTKAHDEDFDEADFWVIFNDDVLKDIEQVCFSVSHLCLSYLLVFVLVLVLVVLVVVLLLVVVVPFPGRD